MLRGGRGPRGPDDDANMGVLPWAVELKHGAPVGSVTSGTSKVGFFKFRAIPGELVLLPKKRRTEALGKRENGLQKVFLWVWFERDDMKEHPNLDELGLAPAQCRLRCHGRPLEAKFGVGVCQIGHSLPKGRKGR